MRTLAAAPLDVESARALRRSGWDGDLESDYDDAAALYRTCHRSGSPVRKMIDCLIGAVAIRAGVAVLHADTDFDALAAHTALMAHPD